MTSVDSKGKVAVEINPRPYDTKASVRDRIAAELGVIPELVLLPETFALTPGEVVVTNLVEAAKSIGNFANYVDLFPVVDNQLLAQAYVYAKKELIELNEAMKLLIEEEIKDVIPDLTIMPGTEGYEDFIAAYIQRENALNQLISYPELENTGLVPENIEYSSYFRAENLRWTILPEIFNRATPSLRVPVIVAGDRWKVLSGSQGFPKKIVDQSQESLYGFLEIRDSVFTMVRLESGGERGIKISVDAIAYAAAIAPDSLIMQAITGIFGNLENLLVDTPEIALTKGEIHFFGPRFNSDVLADTILNDSVLKMWFYRNDLESATRKKPGLFIYFTPDSDTKWPIELFTGNMADATEGQRIRFGKTHTSGNYVTAKIKAKTQQEIALLKTVISSLLQRYQELEEEYARIYKEFIPRWVLIPPVKRQKLAGVLTQKYLTTSDERRALDPVLFPVRITRKCAPENQPWVVLDPEEIERIKREDPKETWLEFPRPGEYPLNRREFQSVIQPRMFTCRRPKVRNGKTTYPKAQNINMLMLPKPKKNSKDPYQILDLQVPVTLCCEVGSRRRDMNRPLGQWLAGESENFQELPADPEKGKSKTPFSTMKIAPRGRCGKIPSGVEAILSSFLSSGEWFRYGVTSRENSAIESVAMAVGAEITANAIESYRDSSDILSVVCSQENPEKTPEVLDREIRGDGYFSPRKFYRFLEELFNVRILLFTSIDQDGLYSFQGLHGEYFFNQPERPVVCLLEHMGSERDALQFPHTELLGYTVRNTAKYTFTGETAQRMINLREKASRFVLWSRPNITTQQTVPVIPNVTRQVIDQFGKCRGVEIDSRFFLEIPPCPPYNAPIMELADIPAFNRWSSLQNYNVVLDGNPVNGRNSGKIIVDGQTIPIVLISAVSSGNSIETFWRNKRLARVLEELFFYRFAKWWEFASVDISEEFTEDMVRLFAESAVVVETGYEYPTPVASIEQNSGFYQNSRLILPSDTAKQRLMYLLYRQYRSNPEKILAMKTQEFLTGVYVDRYDFTENPGVILLDESQLEEYSSIAKSGEIQLRFVVDPDETKPYFLRLDSKVFLAKNFDSLDSAVNSGIEWESGGTKTVNVVPESLQWNYRLYVTQEKFRVGSGRFVGGFEVLGYTYPEITTRYTVVYW